MSSFPLELPERLTISEVKLIWNDWQMLLTHASELIMDASIVQEIDTAGMQLVLACIQESANENIDVAWDPTPSEAFLQVADTLGMTGRLGIE